MKHPLMIGLSWLLVVVPTLGFAQKVSKVSISPAAVQGGATSIGTITLSAKAGPSGVTVAIAASGGAVSVPSSITVGSGKNTAQFNVTTVPVATTTAITISSSFNGSQAKATLTVKAPTITSLTLSPNSVSGGANVNGTVNLNSVSPAGGMAVALSSSSASAKTPLTVVVPGGTASANFSVTTYPVAAQATAKITATSSRTSIGISLTIKPPTLASLSLSPSSVSGGATSTGTLIISGIAPAGGLRVTLKSEQATVKVPASVTLASGTTSTTFAITTSSVPKTLTANITATTASGSAQKAGLTVVAGVSYTSLFPLTQGRSWTYQVGTYTIHWTALGAKAFDGQKYLAVYNDGLKQTNYYNWSSSGLVLNGLVFEDPNPITRFSPPQLQIPSNLTPGYTWTQQCDQLRCDAAGSVSYTVTQVMTGTIIGVETITVPAGTFKNALHASWHEVTDGSVSDGDIWYVPNVGMVKLQEQGMAIGYALKAYH